MKTPWQIKDLIDLEYFLHTDAAGVAEEKRTDVEERDRGIYLKYIRPRLPESGPFPRRFALKVWLDRRRKMEKEGSGGRAVLPGEMYEGISRMLGYALFIAGGMTGLGLAFFILTYNGAEPVNVSVYLASTVFIQILLLLVLLMLFFMRLLRPRLFYTSAVYSVLSHLIISLVGKVKQKIRTALPGGRREGMSAVAGLIRGKNSIYGSLLYWPVFIIVQLYGIGFNLGVLIATLLRVTGTDLAFGWQSTLRVSAEAVYRIVKAMATPWSWFVSPELAYPSLSQVEGSRLILKDGIYHLATPDLVAWWPFLCFAVIFYGLLPRVVLYLSGIAVRQYLLKRVDLTHSDCDRLIDRMLTPQVRFGAPDQGGGKSGQTVYHTLPAEDGLALNDRKIVLLVPEEIFETVDVDALKGMTAQALGGQVLQCIKAEPGNMSEVIRQIDPSGKSRGDWTHLMILKEAWQPPLVEDVRMIKILRSHIGPRTPVIVGLTGKPVPGKIFTAAMPVNLKTWTEKIMTLGDPYIRTEPLVHGNT